MNDRILVLGPYFGDWKQEIFTFRPYIQWIKDNIEHKKVIVSSHFNRSFLYDWCDYFIPIERRFTEEELEQKNYIHKSLSQRDFFKKERYFKDIVCEKENCVRKDLLHYNVNYVKFTPTYPIFQKKFTPIKTDYWKYESKIVFIPDRLEREDKLLSIYNHLKEKFDNDLIVIGDSKCRLQDKNALDLVEYTDKVYKYLIGYITNAKLVVTPTSYWTLISNIQGSPIFSWGRYCSPYKEGGEYHFDNENMIISSDKDTPINVIINQLDYYLEKLNVRQNQYFIRKTFRK